MSGMIIVNLFTLVMNYLCHVWFSVGCSTTFITCPADPSQTLGIKLPFLVMIIKNLKKYFTFEVQVGQIYSQFCK